MENSQTMSEGACSRNSSIFGSAHTINRRLIESPDGGLQPMSGLSSENDPDVEDYGSVGSDLEFSDSDYDYEDYEEICVDKERIDSADFASVDPNDDDDDDEEEEVEVVSDEERAIVVQIKEEIKNKIRKEMEDELDLLYLQPPDGKTKPRLEEDQSLDDLEPKLKEAILKMRKYDRILAKKEKREREVKRERLRLQKRLRRELEELTKCIDDKHARKEELANTEKFLALAPPPKHSEGIVEDSPPGTPVFATQLPDCEFSEVDAGSKSNTDRCASGTNSAATSGERTKHDPNSRPTKSHRDGTTSGATSRGSRMSDPSVGTNRSRKKKKKDFIKRNIQLTGDAGNIVAMTDDEKCRLDQLLKDISDMPDIPEGHLTPQAFEVAMVAGEGYRADNDQRKELSRIDDCLSALLPDREFKAISSTRERDALTHCQYLSSTMRVAMELERLGEPTLRETKEDREMRLKLEAVEKQLEKLSVHADLEVATPVHLSEDMLQVLLGEYAHSLSRATYSSLTTDRDTEDDGSEIPALTLANMYENAPRLDDQTLRRLLDEANSGRLSSDELTNQSDDSKVLRMGHVSGQTCESNNMTSCQSCRTRPVSDKHFTDWPETGQRPRTSDLDLRRSSELGRPRNEPRVLLPEINPKGGMFSQTPNNKKERSLTRERRADNFIHNSLGLDLSAIRNNAVSGVSPPLVAPPRRPPSKPRILAPISTHLDLNLNDQDDGEK